MTREDAKAFMRKVWRETTKGSYAEEAYEMAIKALEEQPCDDAVSRQAAITILDAWLRVHGGVYGKGLSAARELIADLPAVQPQRKKGKWIHIRTEADGNALYECSECHMGEVHVPIVEVKYCWNCGAKMEAVTWNTDY